MTHNNPVVFLSHPTYLSICINGIVLILLLLQDAPQDKRPVVGGRRFGASCLYCNESHEHRCNCTAWYNRC